MKSHAYEAHVRWTGAGHGPTVDYRTYSREFTADVAGKPQLTGSSDPAYRGDPAVHNPEELLLIALSSCHLLSYLALCVRNGVQVLAYEDHATATMAERDGKMRFIEAVLHPRCTVSGDVQTATRLHEQAHAECFIANSVNFPVRNEPVVNGTTLPAEAHYSA
ncbi:MAG: OsmC family protein [Candidatus Eremiobacteraeota bacterium]|nr:OsmC family protein [Candidatus Eremiobacteraeota bacterium]